MTTLQVLITIQADTNYSRTQSRVMDRIFLTPEGGDDDLSDRRERYLFNWHELQDFINDSFKNYYSLNDLLLEHYTYLKKPNGDIESVNVDVLTMEAENYQFKHHYYALNSTNLGPFGDKNNMKGKLVLIYT